MLQIRIECETVNDHRTPLTIAQALIDIYKPPAGLNATSEDDEKAMVCLEEIANHLLLYVDAHRRLM